MTTMSSARNNSGNGSVLFLLFITIATSLFFIAKTVIGIELSASTSSTSLNWQMVSETVVVNKQWLLSEQTVWKAAPEGLMPDLFDPNSFCNKHDIQSLTGSPCFWLKEVSYDDKGNIISYKHTLKSGENEIAQVELQKLRVSEYKELIDVSKHFKAGAQTGWFEYVKVAEWTRGIGLGKTIWHAINKWTAIMSGGETLRIVADASEIGWIPNMLAKALNNNSISNVIQVADKIWVFIAHP